MSEPLPIIRPVVARIDLENVRHNVRFLKGMLRPDCRMMAVVKADAYGHGAVEVSRAALSAGADCLGVALVEEAILLRREGFECPLYLLFEPPPEAAGQIIENDMVCSVYTESMARALSQAAVEAGDKVEVFVKVDTGMRRVGVYPEDAPGFTRLLKELPGIIVRGISTHLAVATEPGDPFTDRQIGRFELAAREAEAIFGEPLLKHAANSAGVLAFPESHYDMVRVGIAMLGLRPSPAFEDVQELRPAMSLEAEVSFVKRLAAGEGVSYGLMYAPESDIILATIPLGYADGFSRILTGKADVLIGGKRRPVVGAICMDLCMVDMDGEWVEPGESVTIMGADGDERITAEELARKLGTINYEVTCMISSRVPRVYVPGDEPRRR